MKFLLMILFSFNLVFAQGVLSEQPLIGFDIQKSKSERATMNALRDNSSSFAVVRGDVLYLAQKGLSKFDFKDYYILGKLKKRSRLFLVTRKEIILNSEQDFKKKRVSIGNFNNLSALYLRKIFENSDKSLRYTIHYKFYNLEESLEEMKKKDRSGKSSLDAFFLFDDSEKSSKIKESGIAKENSMPEKMMDILLQNKGFERKGSFLETGYYLIVRNDVKSENSSLVNMVLKLEKNGLLIEKENKNLGMIHPDIQSMLDEYHNGIDLDKKIKQLEDTINQERENSLRIFPKIEKILSKIREELRKFSDELLKATYIEEANKIGRDIKSKREEITYLKEKLTRFKKNKNIQGLESLIDEIHRFNSIMQTYKSDADGIIPKINIAVLGEKKEEEKKKEEMMNEVFEVIQSDDGIGY